MNYTYYTIGVNIKIDNTLEGVFDIYNVLTRATPSYSIVYLDILYVMV